MISSGRVVGFLVVALVGRWVLRSLQGEYHIYIYILGGGFNYFFSPPIPGEMMQFDEHIFQMGGSTTNSKW